MRWYVAAFVAILLGLCEVSLSTKAYIFDGEYYDQDTNKWPLVEQSVPWNDLEISDESDQKKYNSLLNPNSNLWLFDTKSRSKRQNNGRPMLSILNPLDVLRQRLMLEMDRRRTQQQIKHNKDILEQVGKRKKRSLFLSSLDDHISDRVQSVKSDEVERSENSIRAA